MTKKITVSIDGLDGTGKTTLADALSASLLDRGISSRVVSSPIPPFRTIRNAVEEIGGLAAMLYYAAGNVASLESDFINSLEEKVIIFDRHIFSTLSYFRGADWESLRRACLVSLPKPTVSFHVVVPRSHERNLRLNNRGLLGPSDRFSVEENEAIEKELESFGLIRVDNSAEDMGRTAVNEMLKSVSSLLNLIP